MEAFLNPPEDQIDFNIFIRPSIFMLRLALFDFFEAKKADMNRKERFVFFLKISYFIITTIAIVCACTSVVTYLLINLDNFVNASSCIPTVLSLLLLDFKILTTFYKKQNLREMFHELSAMFADRVKDNKKHKVKKCLMEYYRLIKFYFSPLIIVGAIIFLPIIPYLYNGTMLKPLTHFAYPFDPYQLTTYPLAWIWSMFIFWNGIFYLCGCDMLLYGLITVIAMEFDVLKVDLNELMLVSEKDRKKRFGSLIERHNKLLKLCDKLQDIYSSSFLLNVTINSIIMCFIVFEISSEPNMHFTLFAYLLSFLIIFGVQTYQLCSHGQKLIDSNGALAESIYDCMWESNDDNIFRKDLILVIARSQRERRLTAMGFTDISLETFANVSSCFK